MKLLLSAYACEPGKGSEPGVGWNWVQALLRSGYDLHVITRSNNRAAIESFVQAGERAAKFHYYDLPSSLRFWKKWPGGIYFYYLLWQIGAYRLAARLHAREHFDLVQHITFVSFRQPSFMGLLGIPFVFGPVGGGETMPAQFRNSLPLRARIAETVRNLGNNLIAFDPLMRMTYGRATIIACATGETLARIPAQFRSKGIVQRAIGIDAQQIQQPQTESPDAPVFLHVGRLLYWKGLHLALRAMRQVREELPNAKMRIIGEGPDGKWLRQMAEREGVLDSVEWIPSLPHDRIMDEYRRSTAFVFPSLHDSGGMVVLEALASGLPVVCLNLGGPGSIVDESCGRAIESRTAAEDSVIRKLAEAMILLAKDSTLRSRLSANAVAKVQSITWQAATNAIHTQWKL